MMMKITQIHLLKLKYLLELLKEEFQRLRRNIFLPPIPKEKKLFSNN